MASSSSSFSGSATALFAISANPSSEERSTTVLVAGQSVVVNQAGVGQTSQGDPAPPTLGEPTDTEVVFFHTDAIGSVRMVTDAQGAVLHRYDYTPDGALISESGSGVPWNRRSWAGKERDVETAAGATAALDYFGARSYAQQLGRFTAVDPVLVVDEALVEPQRWNRYAYGALNPLKYADPDGRDVIVVNFPDAVLGLGHVGLIAVDSAGAVYGDFNPSVQGFMGNGVAAAVDLGHGGIAVAGGAAFVSTDLVRAVAQSRGYDPGQVRMKYIKTSEAATQQLKVEMYRRQAEPGGYKLVARDCRNYCARGLSVAGVVAPPLASVTAVPNSYFDLFSGDVSIRFVDSDFPRMRGSVTVQWQMGPFAP